MSHVKRGLVGVVLVIACGRLSASGAPQLAMPVTGGQRAQAVRVADGSISVDGVLDDAAWQSAPVLSSFSQVQPDEGAAGLEGTEVRIVFTASTLYVGVHCLDREPTGIIVSDARRDSSLIESDSFTIILDTYRDRQNGFVFGTNPAGIEYDGQVTNEGQGGGGLGGGPDADERIGQRVQHQLGRRLDGEDADRCVRLGRRVCDPVRDAALPARWRADVGRQLPAQHPATQRAGVLGAHPAAVRPLPRLARGRSGRHHRPRPAEPGADALRARELVASGPTPTEGVVLGDAGGELKYTVTPSLALDATVNTDFAQVEVDDQQVNLDRFNLFFPEKRPFFLENAGFFTAGNPGEVDLFFSRRIGLADSGEQHPDPGGRTIVGQGRRLQRGDPRDADGTKGDVSRRQLRRRAREPRPAQPLGLRRALREPAGDR